MTTINIGHTIDLDILRTSHALATGVTGAGKSYLCRVLVEELQPHMPVHIVDPEGDYASLREKFPFVVVAKEGGDAIAHPSTARELALKLLELHASAVFDLYELPIEQQHEWVRNYVEGLMSVPKEKRTPAAILIDEAHRFCPENGEGDSVAKMPILNLASAGRKRGFLNLFATQRLSRLDMSARSECQNQFIGRTFNLADAQKSAKIVGIAGPKATAEFLSKLRVLPRGHFYAIGVAVSPECVEIEVKPARTSHPKPGELRAPVPPAPAAVRKVLASLEAIPAQLEAKEKEERDLRGENLQLREELSEAQARVRDLEMNADQAAEYIESLKKETAKLDPQKLEELQAAIEERLSLITSHELPARFDALRAASQNIEAALGKFFSDVNLDLQRMVADLGSDVSFGDRFEMMARGGMVAKGEPYVVGSHVESHPAPPALMRAIANAPAGSVTVHVPNNGDGKLNGTAKKMLDVLLQWYPRAMNKGQVAAHAGIKARGGNWTCRLSELSTAGLIEKNGNTLRATEKAKREYGASVARMPRTTREVMDLWRQRLNGTAYKMLEFAVSHRGHPVTRDAMAQSAGIQAKGGNWTGRLSELRTAGLIVDAAGSQIAANKEVLFL
jgi:hypothetical protein